MKKLFQVVLTCLITILFAQNKEFIKLKGHIPNNGTGDYNSLIFIDKRENKTIGILPFGETREMKEVSFENSAEDDFTKWYQKSNLKGGKQDLVLVLNELKLSTEDTRDKKNIGMMNFSMQSFMKEGNQYQFLYKKDTVLVFTHKDVSDMMVKNMYHIFSSYFDKTYKAKPAGEKLTFNEISDYQTYVNNYAAFKNDHLKDGIYLDYISFFKQTPEEGNYVLERLEGGKLSRAVKTEDGKNKKIPARKIFMYVENGKAFKNTYSGFFELNKNEKEFYIYTKPELLFPPHYNVSAGAMFGLVGGIVDAIVYRPNQKGRDVEQNIYIDPMTGDFDLE